VDKVVVAECGARAPKHTEFHLAKRLQRGAEELPARDCVKPLKNLGRRPDSQSRQERKRAEICGSAKQPTKTEETRSRADIHPQDFYGPDAALRCEIRRRRHEAFVERFKKLAQVSTHNDATQHPASDTPFRRRAGLAVSWP
jgi:hypothetical protein